MWDNATLQHFSPEYLRDGQNGDWVSMHGCDLIALYTVK